MKPNRLILHSSICWHLPLRMDIDIAQKTGFDGIDPSMRKLQAYLDAGHTEAELRHVTQGVDIPGFGVIHDIERQGADEAALMRDAERVIHMARLVGAGGIQVIPGPMDVRATRDHAEGRKSTRYPGVLGLPRDEQIAITARGLRRIAVLAAQAGLLIYLEPMSWTPLCRLVDAQELLSRADCPNVRLCIDYWHCFTAGDRAEDVAKLDAALLYGVHICDSLPFDGGIPDEVVLRNLPLGSGVIDLREWTDAVKSTGYRDWWGSESMCTRQHQLSGLETASDTLNKMRALIED